MASSITIRKRAIRDHATRMWQSDGSPKGRFNEYLERARELQAITDNPSAGQLPNPMIADPNASRPQEPVEEAELMENLGEFPSGFNDQGERNVVPMTRKKSHQGG